MSRKNNLSCFIKSPFKWYCFEENAKWYWRNIKFAWQRAVRGYSDRDVWSLCDWHAEVSLGAVKELRETLHGAPATYFNPGAENPTEMWEKYLGKIESNFERWLENGDPKAAKEALNLMGQEYNHLWD